MLYRIILLLLASLTLAACNVASMPGDTPHSRAELGQAVAVGYHKAIDIAGEDLTITFSSVLADGRCPARMSCTATLPVDISLQLRSGDDSTYRTFSVYTGSDGEVSVGPPNATPVQEYAGYAIALERVRPYPTVDGPPAKNDYEVTVRVTKGKPAGPVARPPGSVPAQLGMPVTVGISQTAIVIPTGIKITVVDIMDHRCPPMTICEEPSIVVVDLDAAVGGQTQRATVGGVTDETGHVTGPLMETRGIPWAQVDGYTIELTAVTPYPRQRVATEPTAFAVTLVVTANDRREPLPVAPTAAPAPKPAPTTESAAPVLSFDAAGNPLLCVSERALVSLAAGVSAAAPVTATPLPIGAVSLPSELAGDEICAMFFDENWHMADTGDLDFGFATYLPAAGAFWVWDTAANAAVLWEAGA